MSKAVTARMELDPRTRRYVYPERIVWRNEGAPPLSELEKLQGAGRGECVVKHGGGEAPGFVVDFGRELHGGLHIENGLSPANKPVRVRIRFGESVSEAMGTPNNDHAIHDYICDIPWYGVQEIGLTGFRFVRIDVLEPGAELRIRALRAVFLNRDLEYRGSFRCSDDRLNRIWDVGAYTVHLCMQDRLWDGIKRDRLVWIGDMHPETTVISTVFGEHEIVPQSLDYVRDATPLPQWMNGISSYSIWWVLIQHAWYRQHGNRTYLEEQREYLRALLAQLREQVGPDGEERLGGHRFLDWPSSEDKDAIHAGLHALLTQGLRAGAELCEVLGEKESRKACLAAADELAGHVPAPTTSKQANALLVLAGLADARETNRNVLAADPLRGISTFYGYYVLQARALAGDYDGCLEVIRRYWGAMLDHGATTFWEDFNLDWTENAGRIDEIVPEGKKDIHADFGDYCYKGLRHSLCHGWAAGPTAWMSEHVLGFRPVEPGCRALRVTPHLGDLAWAEGTYPTPFGVVRVRHERRGGRIDTQIEAPDHVRIVRGGA